MTDHPCRECGRHEAHAPVAVGKGQSQIVRALRTARRRQGMTQVELADAIGASRHTVARWERGERDPTITSVRAMARALGMTLHLKPRRRHD